MLKNPKRGTSLGQGGVLVGLTLGIDGRIPIGQVEHGRRGFFTLGVRAGGMYGPALGTWGFPGGADAKGGPSIGLNGGWAALAIGFGGGKSN